jgi:taurine dioxygenase
MDLQFCPLADAPFGVEVRGVTWERPDEITVQRLTVALRGHLLLVLRGQTVPTEGQLDEFMRGFGRLVLETEDGAFHYALQVHQEGPKSEQAIANSHYLKRRADNTGSTYHSSGEYGHTELIWHNDQNHKPQLKTLSVFEAIDCEPVVVPTVFRNMYVAYETLPMDLRARLEFKQVVHFDPRLPGPKELPRLCDAMHPIFTPHPQSGRKALLVNDYTYRIVGFERSESDRLLAELRAHTDEWAPHYFHQWRTGDLCIWDNIGLQHRRDSVPPNQKREMRQHGGVAE